MLRGHNSKVESLHWTTHDSRLISAGKDGAVYQWDVSEGGESGMKREGEYVLKGCSYSQALSNSDGTVRFSFSLFSLSSILFYLLFVPFFFCLFFCRGLDNTITSLSFMEQLYIFIYYMIDTSLSIIN